MPDEDTLPFLSCFLDLPYFITTVFLILMRETLQQICRRNLRCCYEADPAVSSKAVAGVDTVCLLRGSVFGREGVKAGWLVCPREGCGCQAVGNSRAGLLSGMGERAGYGVAVAIKNYCRECGWEGGEEEKGAD